MNSLNEAFLADILDVCSKFFKEMHETCEKARNPNYKPADDSDDEKKPKKPKKKVIDPLKEDNDAPKKPIIQGYLLYYTDVRSLRQKDHPKLLNKDLTKLIADEWNKLPKDKKEPYEIKARVNRQQYEKDLEEYFKKKPHMREVVNQAKNANARRPAQSNEGSVAGESTHKKPIGKAKVLASSSDSEDDAQMKSPSPPSSKKKLTKLADTKRKTSFSEDDSDDDSDDSDDSDKPIKKRKV